MSGKSAIAVFAPRWPLPALSAGSSTPGTRAALRLFGSHLDHANSCRWVIARERTLTGEALRNDPDPYRTTRSGLRRHSAAATLRRHSAAATLLRAPFARRGSARRRPRCRDNERCSPASYGRATADRLGCCRFACRPAPPWSAASCACRRTRDQGRSASVRCESRSPPCRFGQASPPARRSAWQRIALDALTPNRAAAWRHDSPASTVARTRERRSKDSDLGMRLGFPCQPAT